MPRPSSSIKPVFVTGFVLLSLLALANPDRWFERLHVLDANSGRTREHWSVLLIPIWSTESEPTWVTQHATQRNLSPRWLAQSVTTWPAQRFDCYYIGDHPLMKAHMAEMQAKLEQWSPEQCRKAADELLTHWEKF